MLSQPAREVGSGALWSSGGDDAAWHDTNQSSMVCLSVAKSAVMNSACCFCAASLGVFLAAARFPRLKSSELCNRTVRDPILGELPAHAAAAMRTHTCSLLKREKVLQVCV